MHFKFFMFHLYKNISFIIIGLILLFLLFFPINYSYNKKSIDVSQSNLEEIYKYFDFPFSKNDFTLKKEKPEICYILFPEEEIKDNTSLECALFIREEDLFKDYKKTFDFLNSIYLYLRNIAPVSVISKDFYNTLAIFLAIYNPDISFLILRGPLILEYPWIWKIIEPRLCFLWESTEQCTKYKMLKYIHREEMYPFVKQPIIWLINYKEILSPDNVWISPSLKVFHQLLPKNNQKWIRNTLDIPSLEYRGVLRNFNIQFQ